MTTLFQALRGIFIVAELALVYRAAGDGEPIEATFWGVGAALTTAALVLVDKESRNG